MITITSRSSVQRGTSSCKPGPAPKQTKITLSWCWNCCWYESSKSINGTQVFLPLSLNEERVNLKSEAGREELSPIQRQSKGDLRYYFRIKYFHISLWTTISTQASSEKHGEPQFPASAGETPGWCAQGSRQEGGGDGDHDHEMMVEMETQWRRQSGRWKSQTISWIASWQRLLSVNQKHPHTHTHCLWFWGEAPEPGPDGEAEQWKAEQVRVRGLTNLIVLGETGNMFNFFGFEWNQGYVTSHLKWGYY